MCFFTVYCYGIWLRLVLAAFFVNERQLGLKKFMYFSQLILKGSSHLRASYTPSRRTLPP
jgi:hypothetical protein